MIEIRSRIEYDYAIKRGYQPLIDWRMFRMCVKLRKQIQKELFGAPDFQKENIKFYKWVWDHSIHKCNETGQPLYNYSSVYISHIISKGSDRAMAIDPRNVNILSYKAHNCWENGNRKRMNIYKINYLIIKELKKDYSFVQSIAI